MSEIKPNQDFKHDKKTYKKGRKYEVSPEDAEYFQECGWVGERLETGKTHLLDVQDMQLGHSSEVN